MNTQLANNGLEKHASTFIDHDVSITESYGLSFAIRHGEEPVRVLRKLVDLSGRVLPVLVDEVLRRINLNFAHRVREHMPHSTNFAHMVVGALPVGSKCSFKPESFDSGLLQP